MKQWIRPLAAALMVSSLSACVIAPPRPVYVAPAYTAPAGVVYVAPTYESPGPGYAWAYHAQYGWGWHHPHYGWHRGWR